MRIFERARERQIVTCERAPIRLSLELTFTGETLTMSEVKSKLVRKKTNAEEKDE